MTGQETSGARTPNLSPAHALLAAEHQRPDRPSLIDASSGRSLSVEESARLTRGLAWYFHSLGIGSEDRIVVCAPNSIWHFIVHAAASWIHAVTVPVSPLLPDKQRQEIYELVSPALIISIDGHCIDGVSALPISLVEERASETANQIPAGWEPLTCDNQTAALVFTSGTSRKMRAAQLSHANLWWASQCFRDGFEYSPGSAICGVVAPLSHIGGFNGTSMDIFTHGGTVVVFSSFQPLSVVRGIEKWRISIMFVVPAMCHMLLNAAYENNVDLSSWTHPLVGGDAMGESLYSKMREAGLSPIHVWGMTELGGAGTFLSPEAWQRHPGAIGYPFPYIELRLVDPQGNPIDEAGHSGSIEVRGPGVAACYWGDEPRHPDEWFSTSDIGVFDSDMCLHILGRASRVINTGGELVSPIRVEEALRTLESVADCCVLGLKDEIWGQIVAAALIPASDQRPSLRELSEELKEALAPWQHPRSIVWVDALPQTTTGKVDISQVSRLFE